MEQLKPEIAREVERLIAETDTPLEDLFNHATYAEPTKFDDGGEREWILARKGCFSASELHLLMSDSNKFTQGNRSYLYKIQRQRVRDIPARIVFAKTMEIGREQESAAVAWFKANTGKNVMHYGEDCPKLFQTVNWSRFGASPDAKLMDENSLLEIKTLTGDVELNWMTSPTVSKDKKRKQVLKDHGDQIAGQFIAFPDIDKIYLLKYDPLLEFEEFDERDPNDPTRGELFEFYRQEFDLDSISRRIIFAEAYLNLNADIDEIDKVWQEVLGKDTEPKPKKKKLKKESDEGN